VGWLINQLTRPSARVQPDLSKLTRAAFINNLLPVTMEMSSAAVLVAIVYRFVYLRDKQHPTSQRDVSGAYYARPAGVT
jgi:hypothetical protein